jgi:hypothetical protein
MSEHDHGLPWCGRYLPTPPQPNDGRGTPSQSGDERADFTDLLPRVCVCPVTDPASGLRLRGQRLQLSPVKAQEPLRRAVSPEAPTFRSMTSWFALAISAAALLVTVLSYRRDRKASREATTSADRAASRADEAVEAQKRMAEALEAQLAQPAAAWCLEHFQGDSYLLTNTGTASAYHVHLDLGDINIVRGELDSALLRAGDAHKFMAARSSIGTTSKVRIFGRADVAALHRELGLIRHPRDQRSPLLDENLDVFGFERHVMGAGRATR